MANKTIDGEHIKELSARIWCYSDICKKQVLGSSPKQAEAVEWFFKDLHDRLERMFGFHMSDEEFRKHVDKVVRELKEQTDARPRITLAKA